MQKVVVRGSFAAPLYITNHAYEPNSGQREPHILFRDFLRNRPDRDLPQITRADLPTCLSSKRHPPVTGGFFQSPGEPSCSNLNSDLRARSKPEMNAAPLLNGDASPRPLCTISERAS